MPCHSESVWALEPQRRFRLVGVGLSNFNETEDPPIQPILFD